MWGQIDGVAKVEIARDAIGGLVADWEAGNTNAGLIAYGHRRRGDCTDIELLAQPNEGADIASLIANLQPRGKTPLSDAADASGLSEAMEGVAQVTAVAAPEEPPTQDFQEVTIRVKMQTRALALPEEIKIYGNDSVLGMLTDDTAVIPGLPVQMPFGPITLRVEGAGISGERVVEITDQTEIIDLEVTGAQADYVIWREGQLPVLEGGAEHIILLKNTTGVDRASFYRSFLFPAGSTDRAQVIKAGNIAPNAGVYTEVRIPSPATPGDYELVPTANDGTEYARTLISLAAAIDPVWQGPREVAVGEVFDAFWARSSNRSDWFQIRQDGKR